MNFKTFKMKKKYKTFSYKLHRNNNNKPITDSLLFQLIIIIIICLFVCL